MCAIIEKLRIRSRGISGIGSAVQIFLTGGKQESSQEHLAKIEGLTGRKTISSKT
jgi:hypothetical protein